MNEINNIVSVVNNIIAIPDNYHKLNKSWYHLVIDSGYLDCYNQITEQVILDALEKQPERVNEWVQWSEDQRVSEGWFLRLDGNIWNIGAFSTKEGYKETLTPYPDLKQACAAFIKLEVEYTRELAEVNNKKRKKKK
jgi:hypothetical protein